MVSFLADHVVLRCLKRRHTGSGTEQRERQQLKGFPPPHSPSRVAVLGEQCLCSPARQCLLLIGHRKGQTEKREGKEHHGTCSSEEEWPHGNP